MNLTERILDLLKSNTMTMREVADTLGDSSNNVSGTITRLRNQGQVVVVNNRKKGHWTYKAAKDASIGPSLAQQIVDLLKTKSLTVPEIDQMLGLGKPSSVSSSVTVRLKVGEIKVVGRRKSEKTGRLLKVYGINPKYEIKQRSVKAAITSKVNKELSKQFRVFRPTHDRHVLGVWV